MSFMGGWFTNSIRMWESRTVTTTAVVAAIAGSLMFGACGAEEAPTAIPTTGSQARTYQAGGPTPANVRPTSESSTALEMGESADLGDGLKAAVIAWEPDTGTAQEENWVIVEVRIENEGSEARTRPDLKLLCDGTTTGRWYGNPNAGARDYGLVQPLQPGTVAEAQALFGYPTSCGNPRVQALPTGIVTGDKQGIWPLRGSNCDPSYPDDCIPSAPPDLDCGEITQRGFRVLPPDPHAFDENGDGRGCESQ